MKAYIASLLTAWASDSRFTKLEKSDFQSEQTFVLFFIKSKFLL